MTYAAIRSELLAMKGNPTVENMQRALQLIGRLQRMGISPRRVHLNLRSLGLSPRRTQAARRS